MVLGYIDLKLSEKINENGINNYQILRYRDDYRIFVNNQNDGEQILKLLTETLHQLGLKVNCSKTKASSEIVRSSIKSDKLSWLVNHGDYEKVSTKDLRKQLLIIHDHAHAFPHSGSVMRALDEYYKRIEPLQHITETPLPMISIITDIAFRNPRTYPHSTAILSKLLSFVEPNEKKIIINKIRHKFQKIPNTCHMQIWLQRLTYCLFRDIKYEEKICKLVIGEKVDLWNSEWVTCKTLKNIVCASKIIDRNVLEHNAPVLSPQEVSLFKLNQYY